MAQSMGGKGLNTTPFAHEFKGLLKTMLVPVSPAIISGEQPLAMPVSLEPSL